MTLLSTSPFSLVSTKVLAAAFGLLTLTASMSSCGHSIQLKPSRLAKSDNSSKSPYFTNFLKADTGSLKVLESECNADCQLARKEFRYIVYVGKQIYAYWDLKTAETGTDFDVLAQNLEQSITNETTPTQYYAILRKWASAFHDGHVNVLMKDDKSDIEIFTSDVRFETLSPGSEREAVIVTQSADPSVLVGDVVLSVDGKPFRDVLSENELEVSGSTKRMRRLTAANRISDILGVENGARSLVLEIRRGETTLKVEVPRKIVLNPVPPAPGTVPAPLPDTGAANFNATILPGNFGYFRIDGFAGSQSVELISQSMSRLSKTKGLIIDLRKNGGGDQSGNAIISRLIKSSTVRYSVSERISDFLLHARPEYFGLAADDTGAFARWRDLRVQPSSEGLSYSGKPVVAITSPRCFSACDTFSSALKSNGLATMVGEVTGGGTGTPLVFELPYSGHSFRYSVVRGRSATGELIEGQGTPPDVIVEPSLADRKVSKDSQFELAYQIVAEKALSPNFEPSGSEAAKIVKSQFGHTWEQSLAVAPTLAEVENLKNLFQIDENK